MKSMLKVIDLEIDGTTIKIDGFRIRKVPLISYNYSINWESFYSDTKAIVRFEPRIELISRQIESMLRVIEVFAHGFPVIPTGFRLKELSQWRGKDENNQDPYFAILQYLSWMCSTNCAFCLHKNDPPGYYTKSKYGWKTRVEEIDTRLKYWDPEDGLGLFGKSEYNYFEMLTHPEFKKIAKKVRDKTDKIFNIITSGSFLSKDLIDFLCSIHPVLLGISLNSCSPSLRLSVMKDNAPETALKALPYLRLKTMPFFVSLVTWHDIPVKDMIKTIKWSDQFEPYFIRINLDAHTRFSPFRKNLKSSLNRWKEIVSTARELRKEINTPILFQPAIFEERFFTKNRNRVIIDGVVKNSPAWNAGFKAMDEIISINGVPIGFRNFARHLLNSFYRAGIKELRIGIIRNGKTCIENIQKTDFHCSYPYKSGNDPIFSPYGFLIRGGLDLDHIMQIKQASEIHNAQTILFLTSYLMKDSLEEMIKISGLFDYTDKRIFLEVPAHNFWGGDIMIGDLLIVDDFIDAIHAWVKNKSKNPDLVLIPSTSFNKWGRDIIGRNYLDIQKHTGITTELIQCERIESIN